MEMEVLGVVVVYAHACHGEYTAADEVCFSCLLRVFAIDDRVLDGSRILGSTTLEGNIAKKDRDGLGGLQ